MDTVFGIAHIIFLCISILLVSAGVVAVKFFCKTEKSLNIIIKIISIILLIVLIISRIGECWKYGWNLIYLLPTTISSFTALFLGIAGLFAKKDSAIFHCLVYVGFWGGLFSTIIPSYITQADSIFYLPTISSMIYHVVMIILSLIMLVTGYVKPSLKKWWYLPLGLSVIMTYGIFLIDCLGVPNAMYIGNPLVANTILTWYFVGAVLIVLHTLILLIIEYIRKRKNKVKD